MTESETITEKIQATYRFTEQERLELADQLTAAMREEAAIDSEFQNAKTQFKGRLERAALETAILAEKVRARSEVRDTLAVVAYNEPHPGRKSYFYAERDGDGGDYEPGEFIREERMGEMDFQRSLPLEAPPEPSADALTPEAGAAAAEQRDELAAHNRRKPRSTKEAA